MDKGVNSKGSKTALAPVGAVLAAAALWGTTGTAQALGPADSSALGVGALRLAVGGATLLVVAAASGALRAQPWRAAARPLVVGGVWVAVYQLTFFEATRRAGVAPATLVTIASAPAFSHLIDLRRTGRRPTREEVSALAAIAAGVAALALASEGSDGTDPTLGIVCALLAGLGYASYARNGRDAIDRGVHSTTTMSGLFCVGAAVAALTLPWQPLGWAVTGEGVLMLAHLGIITLGLAYVLYGWGLGRLPVPTVVTLSLAEPAVAAVLAVVVLDETLAPLGWFGVGLIGIGLALTAHRAATVDRRDDLRVPSAT